MLIMLIIITSLILRRFLKISIVNRPVLGFECIVTIPSINILQRLYSPNPA